MPAAHSFDVIGWMRGSSQRIGRGRCCTHTCKITRLLCLVTEGSANFSRQLEQNRRTKTLTLRSAGKFGRHQ
jgi:hypothetical protein